jgi:hypothetical protein
MTRMWMLPVEMMCDEHLLGEHAEMHQAAGTLANHEYGEEVMEGHLRDLRPDDVETTLIVARHDRLAEEMEERGYDHDDENKLPKFDDPGIGRLGADDVKHNQAELALKCSDCRSRMMQMSSYLRSYYMTYAEFFLGARPGWPDDAWGFREDEDVRNESEGAKND